MTPKILATKLQLMKVKFKPTVKKLKGKRHMMGIKRKKVTEDEAVAAVRVLKLMKGVILKVLRRVLGQLRSHQMFKKRNPRKLII